MAVLLQPQKREGPSADDSTFWSEFLETRTEMASLIPTARPKAEETLVGSYMNSGGTVQSFMCREDSSFWTGLRVAGDTRTFARCDKSWEWIATECNDNGYVQFTNVIENTSGTNSCGGDYCTTLTIYDSNAEDEKGAQYMIDCKTFLQAPGSNNPYTRFYREYRTDLTTTDSSTATEAPATTHDSTMAGLATSSASSETGGPGNNDGANGLSSGAIAGIVVGTIAGLCLVACGFYIAYRIGRKRRNDAEKSDRGFMGLQQKFVGDDIQGPREMLGDTKQSAPVVELPAEHLAEMEAPVDNRPISRRTGAQH
ncbi:uncharacterized protein NECHADRAFT_82635 [Fusarium vanettenii 77-13-4]|uniref:Mid2 domain-containing protein n=1 Tax=Fusarium vanettenii (strain ATCC MYA-4622 / CBS 123669 / FGSC 9596 / NRRL 45880 / 77-13-4) TaxID=660122 RepID=C7YXS8_FUSV7|nr:uncharacterized protein NECHADRAFT_82635 [Fusarium vanettenii 77-13-4]EEU43396.1 predicted protein [Fusarium vanettenii 77-13-4]